MENSQTQDQSKTGANTGYRQHLSLAQGLFAEKHYEAAASQARLALAGMLPHFSSNNPLLAQCYTLNGQCAEACILPLALDWKDQLAVAADYYVKAVAVLESGMSTLELYQARVRAVEVLLTVERFDEALPLAQQMDEQGKQLAASALISRGESLAGTCFLADALAQSGRNADLKHLVWEAVRHMRAEDFHEVLAVQALQQLLLYQTAVLQEEEAVLKAVTGWQMEGEGQDGGVPS